MKKIFSIFFILLSIKGYAQNTNPQFLGGANSNLIVQGIMNLADSPRASLNWVLTDTNTTKSYFSSKLKGRWAREANGRLYYNPSGTRFVLADSITSSGGGGGAFYDSVLMATNYRVDTAKSNLRTADAARVRYTDTATMLAPYALTSELTNQTGDAGTLQNLHITGTNGNGYLLLRHQASDPTATGQTTVLFSDANGDLKWKNDGKFYTTLRDFKNTADRVYSFEDKSYTLADSAVVAGKLNITDTANIRLRPIAGANMSITGTYPNLTFAASGGGGGGSADSITFATNYRVDTAKANLRASIATKLNIADTATMLTPYLRKVDTTAMLGGYLRKVDTASLSNRINLKANTASPTFTGTVTIPTGANITTPNILGLSSGTTNDSLVVADPSTGALKRISSSRISSGGGGGVSGSGTTNFLPKFTASTTLGNSQIQDDGTSIGINGAVTSSSNRMQVRGSVAFIGGNFTDNPGGFFGGTVIGNNASQGFIQTYGSTPLVLNPLVGSVGIGISSPNARALLDVSTSGATKGGVKFPSFTTTERNAISWVSGDAGMVIWNSTDSKLQVWNGSAWIDLH